MNDKRHLVLYGGIGLVLLIVLVIFLRTIAAPVSNTPTLVPGATTTPSVVASQPAPAATTTSPAAVAKHTPFQFEIVTTPAAQELGLGKRVTIPSDYGMLFVFSKKDRIGFWMKDMLAPIDIIWISDDHTVVGIEDSVLPASYPNVFYPPEPVRYVLETKAGEARRQGIVVGTKLNLPSPLPQGS